MSRCSAEPRCHPQTESPWAFVRTRAKAIWVAVVGTCSPGGGEAPSQAEPTPSLLPMRAPDNLPAVGGTGPREGDPSWWRTPPPTPPETAEMCPRRAVGLLRGRRGRPRTHKYQKLLYRNFCTDPETPARCPLPPEVIQAEAREFKRTEAHTACPPALPARSPLSLPAAVHLLVLSAPVRPSICLHTFGGNLWASLRSWPNPSCPHSLSA